MSISNFPKARSELPSKYREIYEQAYKDNRDGKGVANYFSQKMESWGHKIIENKFNNTVDHKTLEIGAGNLNHLKYVKNNFQYDVVEPGNFFYKDSPHFKRVNKIYSDVSEVSEKEKYDRVISVMVLEHVTDLPQLLQNAKHLLKKDGVFQAAVPCQGELAFFLGWRFTTGFSFFLKHGLDWGVIMKYEHVNSLNEIIIEMKKKFRNVYMKRSPLPFFLKLKHASFYAYLEGKN